MHTAIKTEIRRHDATTRPYRHWLGLIQLLVQRDLRVRYRGSFLGYLWSMMNPLLYMGILTFVFHHLVRFKIEHFAVFILSGILAWNLFLQSVVMGVNSIVANGALLRKVRVPAFLFPTASVCSVLVNFVLALAPYLLIALISGVSLTGWFLLLPLVALPYVVFIFGITLLVASLNVRFRDIGHVMEPLLQITFYATPVLYPVDQLPEPYRQLIGLNPLAHFVANFRQILFYGAAPDGGEWGLTCLLALAALAAGWFVYRKTRDSFIYHL